MRHPCKCAGCFVKLHPHLADWAGAYHPSPPLLIGTSQLFFTVEEEAYEAPAPEIYDEQYMRQIDYVVPKEPVEDESMHPAEDVFWQQQQPQNVRKRKPKAPQRKQLNTSRRLEKKTRQQARR